MCSSDLKDILEAVSNEENADAEGNLRSADAAPGRAVIFFEDNIHRLSGHEKELSSAACCLKLLIF